MGSLCRDSLQILIINKGNIGTLSLVAIDITHWFAYLCYLSHSQDLFVTILKYVTQNEFYVKILKFKFWAHYWLRERSTRVAGRHIPFIGKVTTLLNINLIVTTWILTTICLNEMGTKAPKQPSCDVSGSHVSLLIYRPKPQVPDRMHEPNGGPQVGHVQRPRRCDMDREHEHG